MWSRSEASVDRPCRTWRRYERTGDREARNKLILAYSPIVKYVAGRIASRMPAHVELADLVSYGLGGLIEAVERFEPARGIKFESYAATRIRGAIFDELRSLDWVPRRVRSEARGIEAGNVDAVEPACTGCRPTPSWPASCRWSPRSWTPRCSGCRRADGRPRSAVGRQRGRRIETTLLQTLPDPNAVDPAASAGAADLRARIADAIGHLPERERAVLGLRYHQDLRFAEIGEILGVTESRISQLHARPCSRSGRCCPTTRRQARPGAKRSSRPAVRRLGHGAELRLPPRFGRSRRRVPRPREASRQLSPRRVR